MWLLFLQMQRLRHREAQRPDQVYTASKWLYDEEVRSDDYRSPYSSMPFVTPLGRKVNKRPNCLSNFLRGQPSWNNTNIKKRSIRHILHNSITIQLSTPQRELWIYLNSMPPKQVDVCCAISSPYSISLNGFIKYHVDIP